jgi:hypothetical protein
MIQINIKNFSNKLKEHSNQEKALSTKKNLKQKTKKDLHFLEIKQKSKIMKSTLWKRCQ